MGVLRRWARALKRGGKQRAVVKTVYPTSSTRVHNFMRAAADGQLDLVRRLALDCSVNAADAHGNTALMVAAAGGHLDVVHFLAGECGANVNAAGKHGNTAVMLAAAFGHVAVVRCLAKKYGADVNAREEGGYTALLWAAAERHVRVVCCLVGDCRADVNARSSNGYSAVMFVAEYGPIHVIRYLVRECGADVNAADSRGTTALIEAASKGRIDLVRCLVGICRAEINAADQDGNTALIKAAAEVHIDVIWYLAGECGADVNAADRRGVTALMIVASIGRMDVVRFLAGECGALVNATDEDGDTALIKAAAEGHVDVVRYLAGECGADVNAAYKSGTTALMKAAAFGHISVVRYLAINCRADVNAIDEGGYSAIRFAVDRGYQEIQRILTPFLDVKQLEVSVVATSDALPSNAKFDNKPSWFIAPSEIALVNFVESGSVGGEYRAKWLDADAAVKLFLADASSHTVFEDEVRLWNQLRHPNILKIYGACDATPIPLQFFVCEYASNGSLLDYVLSTPLAQQNVWPFLHQAALGLEYLHERGIVHGDLRCSNILIGSDGLSKLANFGRSNSMQRFGMDTTSSRVGSVRWQSPEVLEGKVGSFESDIYSLGMCILEAVSKKVPWQQVRGSDKDILLFFKKNWVPDGDDSKLCSPKCVPGDARKLIWRMCAQDPARRASLSFVLQELERLEAKDCVSAPQSMREPISTFEDYKYGEARGLWEDVEKHMENCDNELYCQTFNELQSIWGRLYNAMHSITLFDRFHSLVRDFRLMIELSSEQTRVLQLSATRATTSSIVAFRRRLRSLWAALGESVDVTREREARWEAQWGEQIEIFVSEASKTYLLLEELKSQEERSAFLASLKLEIEHSSKYTPGQLGLLQKAYEQIASKLETDGLSKLTPDWFIPWYELIVDKHNQLGRGGYGSVFRAKWLDSDVVVKHLIGSGDLEIDMSSAVSSFASVRPPANVSTVNAATRAETLAMFRHEVDIWFGFNHPHVVRLFGACHVGKPFFVCEYATNGTLVSYLREHPDELWAKLHEAALGVQYLHVRGVVHGDLKGNNIVVGNGKKAKVTDFGLSSIANSEVMPEISAALLWVAPECFPDSNGRTQKRIRSRPTFASDVYSLGMCIIEAMRVVEAVKSGKDPLQCLPWCNPDIQVVKYNASTGKLPARPSICGDHQWELIQRMCAFEPEKRIKISTVVDQLATFTKGKGNDLVNTTPTGSRDIKFVVEVISATRIRLLGLQDDTMRCRPLLTLYSSLWDRLGHVHHQIKSMSAFSSFCSLVCDADVSTKKLQGGTMGLIALTETTLRCYALLRRLDKFEDAHFCCLAKNLTNT